MLGGDLYFVIVIGINFFNFNWICSVYGFKFVIIGNLIDVYNKVVYGNGFIDEFVCGVEEKEWIKKYVDFIGDLYIDLYECLGYGFGQLLLGVDQDVLKVYGFMIEEVCVDLFGLYYLLDDKMVELGFILDGDVFKVEYYIYMMNGLMIQLVCIELGNMVEEVYMCNCQFIVWWIFEKGVVDKVVELVKKDGKMYVKINDY